jgi:hypothetical protein
MTWRPVIPFQEVEGFDREFLDYYPEMGEAILLFGGIDELPDPRFKRSARSAASSPSASTVT